METIRIAGVVKQSITDGPGLRFTIFTQGCPHRCIGCHNPQSWDFEGGYDCEISKIIEEIEKNPLLQGVTFSGGEPLCKPEELVPIAKAVKAIGKDIVCYTGYTFEELLIMEKKSLELKELLLMIDILVDGRFLEDERDLTLQFRGSGNQRILDMPKSLKIGSAVVLEKYM